jgi:hypothetical protein
MAKGDPALDDLRYYLRAWRWRSRQWGAKLGYPTQSPFVRVMRPVVSWDSVDNPNNTADDTYEQVSSFILGAIDAVVDGLPTLKRAAVRLTYLRETDYAVYKSNRMDEKECRRLCDEAELEMIPLLRAKGVVLGGH